MAIENKLSDKLLKSLVGKRQDKQKTIADGHAGDLGRQDSTGIQIHVGFGAGYWSPGHCPGNAGESRKGFCAFALSSHAPRRLARNAEVLPRRWLRL
ncbi:hypothetical protein CIG68_10560 [Escherichia coli]|nr:hypothetical protein CIG68_10560 [Escherichia coli]